MYGRTNVEHRILIIVRRNNIQERSIDLGFNLVMQFVCEFGDFMFLCRNINQI